MCWRKGSYNLLCACTYLENFWFVSYEPKCRVSWRPGNSRCPRNVLKFFLLSWICPEIRNCWGFALEISWKLVLILWFSLQTCFFTKYIGKGFLIYQLVDIITVALHKNQVFHEGFSIKNFLRNWSHLLKKSLMENFLFCTVLHMFISHFLFTIFSVLFQLLETIYILFPSFKGSLPHLSLIWAD